MVGLESSHHPPLVDQIIQFSWLIDPSPDGTDDSARGDDDPGITSSGPTYDDCHLRLHAILPSDLEYTPAMVFLIFFSHSGARQNIHFPRKIFMARELLCYVKFVE